MNPFETRYPGMDAKGPFNSISGTLMSIPFCVAVALLHGVPTLAIMTVFDDAKVNDFVERISLITDENVPNLSAVLEIDLPSGTTTHRQIMTAKDFSYDRKRTSELVRRIGAEQGLSSQTYDRLEAFVDALPSGSISEVVSLFGAST
jgi:2-methylcitrate dehydratase PrpD